MIGTKHGLFLKEFNSGNQEGFYLLDRKPKEMEYFVHCGVVVYLTDGVYRYVDSHKALPFELSDNSLLTFLKEDLE